MKGKLPNPADEQRIKGRLPFFSVDTREEVNAVIREALAVGELAYNNAGQLVETTLAYEQTLDNLQLAGERLAEIHARLFPTE